MWMCVDVDPASSSIQLKLKEAIHIVRERPSLISHIIPLFIVITTKKVKLWSWWLIADGAYPDFCSMKRLGVFLFPLDGMLVHHKSLPHNLLGFPNNLPVPIYTPGWREALWELSVLLQGHNTVSLARAWTWTARSRNKSTNHEAAAPPTIHNITPCKKYHMK